jgi:replicative DNA helicase
MQGCAEGERDTTATKIAGYYINKLNLSDTSAILYAWNKLNRPPLPDQDIHKVLRSVSRYKPVEPTEKTGVKIDNVYDADKMVSSYREYLKNLKNNRFRTGIDEIDAKIRGVGGGEVLTIIARAGGFKTAMLQHMLKNYTKYSSNGAIFFSLEMPIANITERFFSMLDGCTGREVENTFNNPNMSKITESSILQFKNDLKNLYVVDSKICLNDVKQYIEIIEKNYNKKIGVVGIDYLGLIDAAGKDEYQIVSSIARGVKDLAKAVNLPIVLLSQVSRKGGDGEVEVSLDMGRGSGAIEEGADFVIGLWQEEKSLAVEETEYNLISRILKNRKGPKGSKWVIDLEPKTLQFSGKSYKYIEPIKKTRKGKTA